MLSIIRITALAALAAAAAVSAGTAGAQPAPVSNEARTHTFGARPCQHPRYVDRTTGRVVTTRFGAVCIRL